MMILIGILVLGSLLSGGTRRHEGSALGGLLLLPVLLFGGLIAIPVIFSVLAMFGSAIGGVFAGLSSLASGAFSGISLVIGIVAGVVLYYIIRRRKGEAAEE